MRKAIDSTLLRNLPMPYVDIQDGRLKGFILRWRKSGSHAYLVDCGRDRCVTLGNVHKLKPADARSEANKLLGDAVKAIDVIAARRAAKARTWKFYLDETESPCVMAKRTRRITEQRLCNEYKTLEDLKLMEIPP